MRLLCNACKNTHPRQLQQTGLFVLVDEFRICCQSLFHAIISQQLDMTYKLVEQRVVGGRSELLDGIREGANGWRCWSSDAWNFPRIRQSRGVQEERTGGGGRIGVDIRRDSVTHARGTVNASGRAATLYISDKCMKPNRIQEKRRGHLPRYNNLCTYAHVYMDSSSPSMVRPVCNLSLAQFRQC